MFTDNFCFSECNGNFFVHICLNIQLFRCCLGGSDLDTAGIWIWDDGTGDFSPNNIGYYINSSNGLWAQTQPSNGNNEYFACMGVGDNIIIGIHDCYDHNCWTIWHVFYIHILLSVF